MSEDRTAPAVVDVREQDKDRLENLRDEVSALESREWQEIFALCAGLGYRKGVRRPLEDTTYLTRTEYFSGKNRWTVFSIAAAEHESLEVLSDEWKVWKTVEEFAATGAEDLYEKKQGRTEQEFIQAIEEEIQDALEDSPSLDEISLIDEERTDRSPIEDTIARGEDEQLEFKSSIRWNYKAEMVDKELYGEITKTLAGLANRAGGRLLIGVKDDGQIRGLEKDYDTLSGQDRDEFLQLLVNIITDRIAAPFWEDLEYEFHQINGKDVCELTVNSAEDPVWVEKDDKKLFYVRFGSSTRELDARDATEYINRHWD